MTDLLLSHEPIIRLSAFLVVLLAMAGWEILAPRRPQTVGRSARWPGNLGIALLNTAVVRLLCPTTALGMATLASDHGWGLLNLTRTPAWLAIPVAMLVLDLALYAQHRVFHAVPALWRLHRMHHADLEFDVTTGIRFHPIEIVISVLVKVLAIAALGAPAVAVLLFEVLLNASSMFNHANARLPAPLDRTLRRVIVTPDMHRVHHSMLRVETDSNFGFNLPWWDRCFGTYRPEPRAGHDGMTIGVPAFRSAMELRLDRMLSQPFRRVT